MKPVFSAIRGRSIQRLLVACLLVFGQIAAAMACQELASDRCGTQLSSSIMIADSVSIEPTGIPKPSVDRKFENSSGFAGLNCCDFLIFGQKATASRLACAILPATSRSSLISLHIRLQI